MVDKLTCPSCGTALEAGNVLPGEQLLVCPGCGTNFPASPHASEPQDAIPVAEEPDLDERPRKQKPKKVSPALIWGLAGIGVVLLVTVAVALAMTAAYFGQGTSPVSTPVPAQAGRPAATPLPTGDWLQDFEAAKIKAVEEKKDVLVLFDGSDWCPFCVQMASEVLSRPEFQEELRQKFVPVVVDFPQFDPTRVQDQDRNNRLLKQFGFSSFPTVLLTDAQGRPYGVVAGFDKVGPRDYLARLEKLQEVRTRRDDLLAGIDRARGLARLDAAEKALGFIQEQEVQQNYRFISFYRSLLDDWCKLADELDPANEKGHVEVFFEIDWMLKTHRAGPISTQELSGYVRLLDDWKKKHRFKNADRAAMLHLDAAELLSMAGKHDSALNYYKEGLAYHPTNRMVQQRLANGALTLGLSTGTGFLVARDGHVLTANHVVAGSGQVQVRLPGMKEPVPAQIVAQDATADLALLKIKPAEGVNLRPLTVGGAPVKRGEMVAAFGYPLVDMVGSGLKLTTGVISSLPEAGTGNMLILDARINPGNSGGPVCDSAGNVVGMVTAKSPVAGRLDSYGMALPAGDLAIFLKKHLKDYQPSAADKKMSWDEVDHLVSSSVLLVMKSPK